MGSIFSSNVIENAFIKLAKLKKIKLTKNYAKNTILHVMTEAYNFGGHTRCVERWISLMKEYQHSCAVLSQSTDFPDNLRNIINESKGELVFYEKKEPIVAKALKLREYASSFEYVVLHTHPHDPSALIAFGTPDFKRPIILFNHADHIFWLGLSVADYVADLNSGGNKITSINRGAKNSFILGIPEDTSDILSIDKNEAKRKLNIPLDKKVIFASGNTKKFEPTSETSFDNIISDILNKDNNVLFYIVGVDKNSVFWPKLQEKYFNNLFIFNTLDYKTEYPLYLSAADLVIDSYPVGGGTALIDALKASKPILSLSKVQSDFVLKSNAFCKDYNKLIEKSLKVLSDNTYANNLYQNILKQWEKYLSSDSWIKNNKKLMSLLPKTHKIYKINRKISKEINYYTLNVCRWVEGDNKKILKDYLKKIRNFLFCLRFRKNEKILRILGFNILNKKIF